MNKPPSYNQGVLNILHALPAEMREEINKDRIEQILLSLTPRAEMVLRMRFGLDGNTPNTYAQIAELFNMTPEGVSALIKRTFVKLRG